MSESCPSAYNGGCSDELLCGETISGTLAFGRGVLLHTSCTCTTITPLPPRKQHVAFGVRAPDTEIWLWYVHNVVGFIYLHWKCVCAVHTWAQQESKKCESNEEIFVFVLPVMPVSCHFHELQLGNIVFVATVMPGHDCRKTCNDH